MVSLVTLAGMMFFLFVGIVLVDVLFGEKLMRARNKFWGGRGNGPTSNAVIDGEAYYFQDNPMSWHPGFPDSDLNNVSVDSPCDFDSSSHSDIDCVFSGHHH